MSGPDVLGPADEQDLQAAEYVIGALPANQARALEALALNDPVVAAQIGAWERRLAPLAELAGLQAPPPVLWQRLALATGIESVIQAPVRPRRGLAGRAGLWRLTTAAASAVAAVLAVLLYSAPMQAPAPLMAALSPAGGPGATFLVRVGPDGLATVVALGPSAVPEGRSLELWALPAGAVAPVSVGLLPGQGLAHLTVPAQAGTRLLVSQEPSGGSPTKQPTGPVVFQGQLVPL